MLAEKHDVVPHCPRIPFVSTPLTFPILHSPTSPEYIRIGHFALRRTRTIPKRFPDLASCFPAAFGLNMQVKVADSRKNHSYVRTMGAFPLLPDAFPSEGSHQNAFRAGRFAKTADTVPAVRSVLVASGAFLEVRRGGSEFKLGLLARGGMLLSAERYGVELEASVWIAGMAAGGFGPAEFGTQRREPG